jgi:hypothetical protein
MVALVMVLMAVRVLLIFMAAVVVPVVLVATA